MPALYLRKIIHPQAHDNCRVIPYGRRGAGVRPDWQSVQACAVRVLNVIAAYAARHRALFAFS